MFKNNVCIKNMFNKISISLHGKLLAPPGNRDFLGKSSFTFKFKGLNPEILKE